MKVGELMTREVRSCTAQDTMEQATRIMWERDCGCVPVTDELGRLAGVITDRDVCMAAYTSGQPLGMLPVGQGMSARVHACHEDDGVEAALQTMAKRQLHRLPVTDPEGRLVGMLSLADVLQGATAGEERPRRRWTKDILPTLGQVTRPRAHAARAERRVPAHA